MGRTQTMPKLDAPSAQGKPLSQSLRHSLEAKHQCDLSAVRVHEGNEAVHLGAEVFVNGSDIYFAPGRTPSPLAHEAWHVVQQAAGRIPGAQNNQEVPPLAEGLVEVP